jgi:hypothetical protein
VCTAVGHLGADRCAGRASWSVQSPGRVILGPRTGATARKKHRMIRTHEFCVSAARRSFLAYGKPVRCKTLRHPRHACATLATALG